MRGGAWARYRYRYRRETAPPRPWGRPGGPGAGRGAAWGGLRAGHGSWGWLGGVLGPAGGWALSLVPHSSICCLSIRPSVRRLQ